MPLPKRVALERSLKKLVHVWLFVFVFGISFQCFQCERPASHARRTLSPSNLTGWGKRCVGVATDGNNQFARGGDGSVFRPACDQSRGGRVHRPREPPRQAGERGIQEGVPNESLLLQLVVDLAIYNESAGVQDSM